MVSGSIVPVLAREKSSPSLGRVVPRGMNGARTSISARKSLMRWSPSLFACRAPSSLVPATFTSLSTATARTRRRICDVDSFWPLARRYLGHPLVAPPLPRPCYVPGRRHLQANQHARQLHWLLSSQTDICVAVRTRLDIDVDTSSTFGGCCTTTACQKYTACNNGVLTRRNGTHATW